MLYYCGNQWGYTPVGRVVNIPTGHCDQPTGLSALIRGQYTTFSWIAPHDYLKFILEYQTFPGGPWIPVDVFGLNYTVALDPQVTYAWRVKTVCQLGTNESSYANGTNFTTGKTIASCDGVSAVTVTNMATFFRIAWNNTGAQYYRVQVRQKGSLLTPKEYTTQGLYYDLSGLVEGIEYEVRVIAACQDITLEPFPSPWVPFTSVSLNCPPVGKINFTVSSNSIIIGWNGIASIYSYNIYLNGDLVATNYPGTSFTFTGLSPNTLYTIEVRRNCRDGFSDKSSLVVTTSKAVCPDPTGVNITAVTASGFTANWTPAGGIASQEIILNNGAPIPLGAGINTYPFAGLVKGSINQVMIRSICTGSVSEGVMKNTTLLGCSAPTGLNVTPFYDKLRIQWTSVNDAVEYTLKVVRTGDAVVFFDGTVPSNDYTVTGLPAGTTFTITVKAVCGGHGGSATELSAPLVGSSATQAIPTCENAIIDELGIEQNAITVGYHFASGRTTGFFTAKILRSSDNLQIGAPQIFNTVQDIRFEGLVAATGYKVYIYNEEFPGQAKCAPIYIQIVSTGLQCRPATAVTATLQNNQTELLVNATPSPDAPLSYDLQYKADGGDWIEVGNVVLPHTITGLVPGRYKVRLQANCFASSSNWAESPFTCPVPTMNAVAVQGNKVALFWTFLAGIAGYRIELTSLSGGLQTWGTTNNFIEIPALPWNTTFIGVVKAICSIDDQVFGSSANFSFATGYENTGDNPQLCTPPVFTAFVQDCAITDPKDDRGGGTGGGGTDNPATAAVCNVEARDWEKISALFVPITTDPPNDTFFEATFRISQNVLAGQDSLMPGGVMGIIIEPTCRPIGSTTLTVEIIQGGVVVSASATMATNGNITVAGSYTSDGATVLIIRVKGNYNKV